MTPVSPIRSAASSPAAPCTATPQAAAIDRRCSGGQEGADRPGQHVAAPGGGEGRPSRRPSGARSPSGLGDHAARALEDDHLVPAQRRLGGRGSARAVIVVRVGGGLAGEARELARVRREHERRARVPATSAPAIGQGVQTVGVDHRRHRAGTRSSWRVRRSVAGWLPRPGPITSAS